MTLTADETGPQAPRGNASEFAYQAILEMILNGEVKGGDKLTESTLAGVVGVSRTPVREGLRRLTAEGVVETSINQGSQVALMTDGDSRDLLGLRAALESAAVRLSVPLLNQGHFRDLEAVHAEMLELAVTPKVEAQKLTHLNTKFHSILMAGCTNRILLRTVQSLVLPASVARTYRLYTKESFDRSLRHHRELVDAATSGDGEWAEAAMRAHIFAARHAYADPLRSSAEEPTPETTESK